MRRLFFCLGVFLAAGLVGAAVFSPGVRNAATGCMRPFLALKAQTAAQVAASLTSAEQSRLESSKRVEQNLRVQIAAAKNAVAENTELRTYLHLSPPPVWRVVVAPVIARDPVTWNRRLRIGKGSADGLRVGAVALNGNQVIGRIAELTPHTALVVTIADTSCRLSVTVGLKNATGILHGRVDQKWQQAPVCMATYLPRDAVFAAGDVVVTSGLGGAVPAGLPVGRLIAWEADGRVSRITDSAYADLLIRPGADFGISRFVGVVICANAGKDEAAPENHD